MSERKMAAMQARTLDEVCSLRRDNFSTEDHWILTDGNEVTICRQRNGENSTAQIAMPRAEFNRLVRWYTRPQRLSKR